MFLHFQSQMKPGKSSKLQITSQIQEKNSERLKLSKASFHDRVEQTMRQLQHIHCTPQSTTEEKIKGCKDGLWVTFVNQCSKHEIDAYVKSALHIKTHDNCQTDMQNRWKKA